MVDSHKEFWFAQELASPVRHTNSIDELILENGDATLPLQTTIKTCTKPNAVVAVTKNGEGDAMFPVQTYSTVMNSLCVYALEE